MKRKLRSQGSWPGSPALPRKAASSPPYGFAQCPVPELIPSTRSSPLPTRRESAPPLPWHASTITGSESTSTLVHRDHCLPSWERQSDSCCSHSEPPHESSTVRTDELLENPGSEDPTFVHGENDDTEASWPKLDFRVQAFKWLQVAHQSFRWRGPWVIVSLVGLAVFLLGLVVIAVVTGTVSARKMEKLEVVPDMLEKEEANPVAPNDVTSANGEKQAAAQTTMSWFRRSKARTQKQAKRTWTATTPKPTSAPHRRTVAFKARRRLTNGTRHAAKPTWAPPKQSRRSQKPHRTRAATITKRRAAKTTTLRGLRGSKGKTQKQAKRRRATTEPKPWMGAHGRSVPSTSSRRRSKVVSRATKRTWAPPNSSRRSRQPRPTRAPAKTKQTGSEIAGRQIVGATLKNYPEEITMKRTVDSSMDPDGDGVADPMGRENVRQPRLKGPEGSNTTPDDEFVQEIV